MIHLWTKLVQVTGSRLTAGVILGMAAILSMGSVANLGPITSILMKSNPLADPQAWIHYTEIDEIVASDGSGLDDLKTVGARAGVKVSFEHATSGAELTYTLISGSPSEDLPHKVLPDDAGSSGFYWQLEQFPTIDGVPLLADPDDNAQFYKLGIKRSDNITSIRIAQSAVTISD